MENAPNNTKKVIKNKMKFVLNNNPDINSMFKISEILDVKETSTDSLPNEQTTDNYPYFQYTPATSVDVKRSFSSYKILLSDN